MFVWNLDKCLTIFEKVYVSSDYDFILKTAEKMGAIPIKRPAELCGDTPNIAVYRHALRYMGKIDGLVAVQCNSPTIDESIIKFIYHLMEESKVEEIITCDMGGAIYGSVWALTAKRIWEYKDPYNPKPDFKIPDWSVDIHDKRDFIKAEKQWI